MFTIKKEWHSLLKRAFVKMLFIKQLQILKINLSIKKERLL
jgi:hypothetical protein